MFVRLFVSILTFSFFLSFFLSLKHYLYFLSLSAPSGKYDVVPCHHVNKLIKYSLCDTSEVAEGVCACVCVCVCVSDIKLCLWERLKIHNSVLLISRLIFFTSLSLSLSLSLSQTHTHTHKHTRTHTHTHTQTNTHTQQKFCGPPL